MANNLCEKLLAGCISVSCDNPIFEGAEAGAWIFNKSEIESITYDAQDPNIITAITMKEVSSGVDAVGYTILQLGKTPYTGTNTALVEGDIMNVFTETVQFSVQDNSPAAAALLDNMANGKFVVVMENQYDGSDNKGKFQAYGVKKGLVVTAMERQLYDDTQNGGWAVTMTAEKTPNSALFVYATSEAATRTMLNSLCSCGEEEVEGD